MRIPGSRTFNKYTLKTRAFLFDVLGMERVLEERHRLDLAEAMGFDGQWDDHRDFQMGFLRRNGLNAQTRFLEIGSGPLTLAIPLMQELDPGHYTGIDVRESVTNLAYLEISREGVASRNPRLIVSDDFGKTALGDETFDMIWSFSVLFHLTDELVADWFSNVKKRLAPEGRYWANFNPTVEDDRWLEFPFLKREAAFYNDLAVRNGLTFEVLGTFKDLGFKGSGAEKDNIIFEVRHSP